MFSIPTRRWALVLAGLLFVANVWRYHDSLLDDAYISLRYARNLVAGNGLVFNPGERVEGYTNFLWVLLGAALSRTGLDPMSALKGVSFLACLATLFVLHRSERLVGAQGPLPASAWLLASPALGYWATTGMETMFFTALLVATFHLALTEAQTGRFRGCALSGLLLALTRLDGVLAFGLIWAAATWVGWRRRGPGSLKRAAATVSLFAAGYLCYFAWRYSYYGELLPNTYHAKITGGPEQWKSGALSLLGWLRGAPLLVLASALLLPLACLSARVRARLAGREPLLATGFVSLGLTLYAVSVGGDFMPFQRFYLPVMPLAALVLSGLLSSVARLRPGPTGRWAGLLLLLHAAAGLTTEEPYRAFVAHHTTRVGTKVGRYLAARLGPGDWIAANAIGSLSYASARPTIDMLGLTDAVVARHPVFVVTPSWTGHRRGHGAYVLARRPRVILWYNSAGLAQPHYLGDHQLADSYAFRFFYQLQTVELPADEPASDRVVGRFLGTPFGSNAAGRLSIPDLGVRFEIRSQPWLRTIAYRRAISLTFFELRSDSDGLWPLVRQARGQSGRFVESVAEVWRQQAAGSRPPDSVARAEVEELCEKALAAIQAGNRPVAKQLLSQAVKRNGAARSPLVYQYVANLATLEGQLFLAVHAQQEALRLDPQNALYRQNLKRLLEVPFADFNPRLEALI